MNVYGQLVAAQLENISGSPSPLTTVGRTWWDTGTGKPMVANGTVAQEILTSTSGLSNPMVTTGDMVYGGAAGVSTKLATGATTGVLHGGNGAVPTWSLIVNADISASAAIDGSKIVQANGATAGVVSGGTQSFAGEKTFANAADSTSTTTGGAIFSGGLGIAKRVNAGAVGADQHTFNGYFVTSYTDASTGSNTNNTVEFRRLSSSTPGAGFGGRIRLALQNASGASGDACAITYSWTNATAGAEASTLAFHVRTGGGALSEKGSVNGLGNWTLGSAVGNSHVINGDLQATGTMTLGSTSGTTARHTIQAQPASLSTQALDLKKQSFNANQNNNLYLACVSASGDDGYIQTNGSGVLVTQDASDRRWKENIRDATYGTDIILALRPVLFDWKDSGVSNVKGFIAQEVKEILPESVCVKDQSEDGGFVDAHYLEMQTMIPVLVKAFQELNAKFEAYKVVHP